MEPSYFAMIAVVQVGIAIFTLSANLLTTQRRLRKTSENDARRLRMLFAAELAILRDSFSSNIEAIYEEKNAVMSSRSIIVIYRANLGRLTVLHEKEIPAVVAAYAFCESIEAHLSANGKPNGQSSYTLPKERLYVNDLVALYNKGAELVDLALSAMREVNGVPGVEAAVTGEKVLSSARSDPRDLASAPRIS